MAPWEPDEREFGRSSVPVISGYTNSALFQRPSVGYLVGISDCQAPKTAPYQPPAVDKPAALTLISGSFLAFGLFNGPARIRWGLQSNKPVSLSLCWGR